MNKTVLFFLLCMGTMLQAATQKKIVVIGGASEIGQSLVNKLLGKGHRVVVADDNQEVLDTMQQQQGDRLMARYLSIIDTEKSRIEFEKIIQEFGGIDMCILCCGIAPEIEQYGLLHDGYIPWGPSKDTIALNVMGTTALANVAMNHFIKQERGYLVGVSSLDALVGHPGCPCYTASKAFMSNYLDAMRKKCGRLALKNIVICDMRWSFVKQVQDDLGIGWIENSEIAAQKILQAIEQKKPVSYIMDQWSFAIWALMAIPSLLRNGLSGVSVL